MDAPTYFSADYQEARAKFRAAARAAGARLTAYENPVVGPDGGTLATDTAWLGPRGATRVLLACSGSLESTLRFASSSPIWRGSTCCSRRTACHWRTFGNRD